MTAATVSDPCWSRYTDTVVEIYDGETVEVDLREPLEAGLAERLRTIGLGNRFAIVTAYNPRGAATDADENHHRQERLETWLAGSGTLFRRADGCSPDRRHREPGCACAMDLPAACTLAERFGQSGLYWFDTDAFWLVPVLETGAQAVLLPASTPA